MQDLNNIQTAIINTVLYYDIFSYPLLSQEIHLFISEHCSLQTVESELKTLCEKGIICKSDNYFYYHKNSENTIITRLQNNKRAKEKLPKIKKYVTRIQNFPFVQAVCISGSYSKGILAEDGDIDYFIITTPERLWLCRSLLILYKKIFLFNSKKYFCVNYFVDTNNLEIPDKNLFTATEVASIIPATNFKLYADFMNQNNWVTSYFPNKTNFPTQSISEKATSSLKKITERFLSKHIGNKLDEWCFKQTLTRWKNKFPNFDETEFDLNMRSRKSVSKHHPQGFQLKVLTQLEEKWQEVITTFY